VQEILPEKGWSKKFPALWRSFAVGKLAHRYQLDIYHGLSHELPIDNSSGNVKWVLTVHDLIFLRYPGYYKAIDRFLYTFKLRRACRRADRIVAISRQTKKDLVSLLSVPEEKISVIYQDCDAAFKREVPDQHKSAVKLRYHLPDRYILQVGTIEERKNLLLSVKALKYTDPEIVLVVVGRETPYLETVKKAIAASGLQQRVYFLHQVPFSDLPAIYQLAQIFLYPSRYEGFGIPIVEALHSKVPVIAATGSCLEEAGGPDSLYTDPDDEQGLAKKIRDVWHNTELRLHMIRKGREHAERFRADKLSIELRSLYAQLS
jgi:glycosyltransferase involved in cell wall biosynthesis